MVLTWRVYVDRAVCSLGSLRHSVADFVWCGGDAFRTCADKYLSVHAKQQGFRDQWMLGLIISGMHRLYLPTDLGIGDVPIGIISLLLPCCSGS